MDEITKLIYGKSPIERIVNIEVVDDVAYLYVLQDDFSIKRIDVPNRFWVLSSTPIGKKSVRLAGNLHYKYGNQFKTRNDFMDFRTKTKRYYDVYSIFNSTEALMVKDGYTYFKGLKHTDPPILCFDIESTSLKKDENSKVLLISNTFRRNGIIQKRLFSYDEYENEADMIDDWASWVCEIDPAIVCGHNIFGYDLPYLDFIYKRIRGPKAKIQLGRDGGYLHIDSYMNKKRVDGSRSISYPKTELFGREIIDTMFLAINYDAATKKYENYGLKQIIKQENLEKENRVFYDASQIRFNYKKADEWDKIKRYCIDDGDDALSLYDLMVPALFYFTRSIPKSFQAMCESATGSQLNSLLVRSYLQDKHSIPKSSEKLEYPGAISFGVPGIYRNCVKQDIKSEYPSCILQYNIYDKEKDPKANFYKMVEFFTLERFRNKDLFKETKLKYYSDIEQSQKIGINSAYGLLGATGLNFNSPANAALVTEKGREVISTAIQWASSRPVSFWLQQAGVETVYEKQDIESYSNDGVIQSNELFDVEVS